METVSAAGGNIEVMLLQQVGSDPFTPTLERAAQIGEVARRTARFISEARATRHIKVFAVGVDGLFDPLARGAIEDPKLAIGAYWLKDNIDRL